MPRRRRRRKTTNVKIKVKKTSKKYTEYISPNKYIAAFYKTNELYIMKNIDAGLVEKYTGPISPEDPDKMKKLKKGTETAFRKLIKDKMKYDNPGKGRKYDANEAIKAVMGSKELNPEWTAKDVYANNFIKKIKSDRELKQAIMNEMDEEKLLKYSYDSKKGKKVEVTKIKEGFQKENVKFEGYFEINKTNAIVYTYDNDIFIIEYKSPKKGSGATFDVISRWDFEDGLAKGNIEYKQYRKRGY